jgi:hypothetical protein
MHVMEQLLQLVVMQVLLEMVVMLHVLEKLAQLEQPQIVQAVLILNF